MSSSMKKVSVEFLKAHADYKKGAKAELFETTAKALAKHKILKLVK